MRNFLAGLAFAPLLLLTSLGSSQADDASDKQAFHDFLAAAKNSGSADKDKVTAFYRTTGAYWRAHWLDYSHNPANYADVMALYHEDQGALSAPLRRAGPEAVRERHPGVPRFRRQECIAEKSGLVYR